MTENLIKKLIYYNNLYYNDGVSTISDEYYDHLYDLAKEKYPNHKFFKNVGSKVKNKKVKLTHVLGSLTKVKPDTVQKKWIDKFPKDICASAKLDGVSFEVIYENGKLVFAATRGDGYTGKNILDKAKIFCPNNINYKKKLILRGEVLLLNDTFKEMGFSTKRNGVAGLLNTDTFDKNKIKNLIPYFYEVIEDDSLVTKQNVLFNFLECLGFNVPNFKYFENEYTIDDLVKFYDECKNFEYETDGIVLVDNTSKRENEYYPKNKMAFKIQQDNGVETYIKDIIWNTTRMGKIIPVIEIHPINIEGVNINRTTGFNAKYIQDNGLNINSKIKVERSGDVIPYICDILSSTKANLPKICSNCGNELIWEGVHLVCDNFCMNYSIVEHFLTTLNVEYITKKTLEKLKLDSIEKLYNLDINEIAKIDGFGIKRAKQIINEIKKTLDVDPNNLLASFGIEHIGKRVSKLILNNVNNFEDIFSLTKEKLVNIKGIGESKADVFISNINNFKSLYNLLIDKGLKFKNNNKQGKNIFTLTGSGNKGRKEYQILIEKQGGEVCGIKTTTNYLVTNDINSTSNKITKAKKYGIKIITYDELEKML